ncbi:MAG: SMP-30/gluconolactonase/LRE family protein [Myxococcaceae bacterium]|nr:SMP-30/gluconolactonase/LRE family protein [Myxococcaceae bacterium]
MSRALFACILLAALTSLAQQPKSPPPAAPKDAGVAAPPPAPTAAVTVKDGLATPESVLYDAESDTWLVSNINGSPFAKDNNGYVTELAPDGKVVTAKLVEGGQKGVTLNAPKGLALAQGTLYVADLDTVRLFDRKTGAAKGEVKVAGATFVNDLFATADGKVYVTDSGFKPGKDGAFDPSGTDGVYVIEPGKKPKLKTLLKAKELNKPNGVFVAGDTLYVVSFGANELHTLDLAGKKKGEPAKLPKGGLDGVVMSGDTLFISSWEGKCVFSGKPGGAFTEAFTGLESPADLGFDSKRNRVLVPHFMSNAVAAWDVK